MAEILTTVYLPSRGVFNKDESVYAGPIELDMMGFEQEKMVFGSNTENALDRMLSSVIKTEGINLDKLVPQDRHFLLIQERIHSYGPNYHIRFKCPYCGVEEEHKIDLTTVPVLEMDEEFKEPIEGVLPLDGRKVGLKILRNGDKKAIEAEIRMKADKLKINPKDLRFELRRVKSIVSIDGSAPKVGEREALLRSLKGRDIAYMDYLINQIQFGYSSTINVTCSGCKEEYEVPFALTSEFFRPRFD